jgi:hypothetical protein
MITLSPVPPAPVNLSDLERLIAVMGFIRDVEACKERLDLLIAASKEAADFAAGADKLRAEIAAERKSLEAEREAQAKEFEDLRTSLEQRRLAWVSELNTRDTESRKMSDAAKADREVAARLKADLERRVKQVQQAVA